MNHNTYTLTFSHGDIQTAKSLHASPAVILACTVSYALSVSLSNSFSALVLASVMPLIFMITKKIPLSNLLKLSVLNAVMIITLALTWPDITGGIMAGIIIALRVNMIYIVFSVMVYPLGTSGMHEALCALGIPEKLRILILLTLRGIYIMRERFETALISVRLRAPGLHGVMKFRVFAYIIGSVLLQSVERSEGMMKAVKCRGGFGGFMQNGNKALSVGDIVFASCFAVYTFCVIILNYA